MNNKEKHKLWSENFVNTFNSLYLIAKSKSPIRDMVKNASPQF